MRRWFCALCVAFLFLSLTICGCDTAAQKKSVITDFSADFSAQYKKMNVKGSVSNNRQGVTNIQITYPETLKGLSFCYKSTELEMKRGGIICSADEAYIPSFSFPSALRTVLSRAVELEPNGKDGELLAFKTELGECIIRVNGEGAVTEAEIKDAQFKMEFSNITHDKMN